MRRCLMTHLLFDSYSETARVFTIASQRGSAAKKLECEQLRPYALVARTDGHQIMLNISGGSGSRQHPISRCLVLVAHIALKMVGYARC